MNLQYIIWNLIFIFFVLCGGNLSAGWKPESLQINDNALDVLQDPELQQLEKDIFQYLQGSWCSQEKAQLIFELVVLTHPKVSVEIGAFTGSTALPLLAGLQYLKKGKAFVIDAWSNEEAIKGLQIDDPNTIWWSMVDMQSIKNQCITMTNDWSLDSYCYVIQTSSSQIASKIGNIDFLHLDGNFSEEGSLQDTLLYLPKVKSGGYILFSNLFMLIGKKPMKTRALWPIFETCEIVSELENGDVILFRKK